jgi:hypothetical protein
MRGQASDYYDYRRRSAPEIGLESGKTDFQGIKSLSKVAQVGIF